MKKTIWKRGDDFWTRYGRTIASMMTAATVVLAFIGSYQYYTQYIIEDVAENRVWSAILYSTLKLYLFSPTVAPGMDTPACYEIAKWLAPVCTAYWVFQAIESLWWHSIGVVKRGLLKGYRYVVFGYNENSRLFIENTAKESMKNKASILLVTEKVLGSEEKLILERKGVLVYQMNFLDDKEIRHRADIKKLRLEKAEAIILFCRDAIDNFTIFSQIVSHFKAEYEHNPSRWSKFQRDIICSIQCEDAAIGKIIAQYYKDNLKVIPRSLGRQRGRVKGNELGEETMFLPLDLRIFGLPDLAATELFDGHPIYENCLERAKMAARERGDGAVTSLEEIPNPHLVIVGFGAFGQAVFEKALLLGTLSHVSEVAGGRKFRISVFDKKASSHKQAVLARYPRLSRICVAEFITLDVKSKEFEEELGRVCRHTPVSYAAVCFADQTMGMLLMMRLTKYFYGNRETYKTIPIAVRMGRDGNLVDYVREASGEEGRDGRIPEHMGACYTVVPFGMVKKLLTPAHIVNSDLEYRARQFHREYEKASGGKTADKNTWKQLSLLKRDSNRVQVLYRGYMTALERELGGPRQIKDRQSYLYMPKEKLCQYLTQYSEYRKLNQLTALEHKRWCCFMYVNGYIGRKEGSQDGSVGAIEEDGTDYYGLVHRCLIDDWDEFLKREELRETVRYDLCSIYEYYETGGE